MNMSESDPLPVRLREHAQNAHLPDKLRLDLAEAAEDLQQHDFSFDLRWRADMRAIKRWQAANPGNDLTWPDHADLVVWLLGELDRLENPDVRDGKPAGQGD